MLTQRDVLQSVTWLLARMHSTYLRLPWPIIQQTKVRPFNVKRSDSPLCQFFRLYLFHQLAQCSQHDLIPSACALACSDCSAALSLRCCLLMFLVCGEDAVFAKTTPSMAVIKYGTPFVPGCLLPLWLPCVPQLMGSPFLLHWSPPAAPLSPEAGHRSCSSTFPVECCLPQQTLQTLPFAELPLTRKSLCVFYVGKERNRSLGQSQRLAK